MNLEDLKTLIAICLWTIDGSDDDALSSMADDLDTTVEDLKSLRSTLSELVHPRHPSAIEAELNLYLSQIAALLAFSRTVRPKPPTPIAAMRKGDSDA